LRHLVDIAALPVKVRHLIVDRDGVLNQEVPSGWLSDPEGWNWEEGSLEALRLLACHGIAVTVATNQSCVGRGLVARESIDRLHAWLADQLAGIGAPLAGIFVCPHAPADDCLCRKPKPGLILNAVRASGVDRIETIVIGDDVRDIEAARAATVPAALVRTGKGVIAERQIVGPLPIFGNLLEAATVLAKRARLASPSRA
jgi:D-glycero-D-manno-heptose 1,7-bisphosphate phosphatase